jgi:hypothetical protein
MPGILISQIQERIFNASLCLEHCSVVELLAQDFEISKSFLQIPSLVTGSRGKRSQYACDEKSVLRRRKAMKNKRRSKNGALSVLSRADPIKLVR